MFFPLVIIYCPIFFIIIIFKFGSDKLVSCFFYCLSVTSNCHGMWLLGWGRVDDDFFLFDCSSPFYSLLIEFHYAFPISYLVLTCYVNYYCIWLCFNPFFSCCTLYCSLPRDQSRDVTPRFGVFVILMCTSFRACIFIMQWVLAQAVHARVQAQAVHAMGSGASCAYNGLRRRLCFPSVQEQDVHAVGSGAAVHAVGPCAGCACSGFRRRLYMQWVQVPYSILTSSVYVSFFSSASHCAKAMHRHY